MRMGAWAETFVQSCHVSSSLSLLKSLTGYTIHIEDKLIAVLREESRELYCFRFAPEAPWWRLRQATRRMADNGLLEAVRGLHLAHPELGPKPLLAKLRQQQPTWQRATRRCARLWRR